MLELNNFLSAIKTGQQKTVIESNLNIGNIFSPVRFYPSEKSDCLVVAFHGAVDRRTRVLPAFSPKLTDANARAHQLSISDPTLSALDGFSISWYAGHEGFHAQELFTDLILKIVEAMGIKRVIFFGTSSGGFAALYYGWRHPGSTVVVGNPQTNINKYYKSHINRYRSACWPNLNLNDELSSKICDDVGMLYGKNIPNSVIYVQNPTDRFHLFNHMVPFLSRINVHEERDKILCHCAYSGKIGHGPSFIELTKWVRATILSPTSNVGDILLCWEKLNSLDDNVNEANHHMVKIKKTSEDNASNCTNTDLNTSDLLRKYYLQH